MAGKPRNRQAAVADVGLAKMNDERERREDKLSKLCATLVVSVAAALSAAPLRAAEAVKIGVLMPLTGNAAAAGQASKAAAEVAADIVNGTHSRARQPASRQTAGLPNMGGAKLELVFVDHQGNPSLAQQLATRLITQDKVHVLMGAYQSSCSFTATAVAERYGIPFMVGEFGGRQHHRSRIQMGISWYADRLRLCSHLHEIFC